MIHQAVVVAGGKGTRLGDLARKYGNKSLVPILGKPILCHTVDWLKEAGVEVIIITVNYLGQLKKVTELFRGDSSVSVIGNTSQTTSAQCLPAIRSIVDRRFFFIYGHAPVPPEHLENLSSIASEGIVASLYPSTTQKGKTKKPAILEGLRVVFAEEGNLFVEPPHIITPEFVDLLAQSESWKEAFHSYHYPIFGVRADHPSEFHYKEDLKRVREWLAIRLRGARRGERFGEIVKNYQRYRKSHPTEIFEKLLSLLRERQYATVLDLGCGSGKSTESLVREGMGVTGCDPDRRMLRTAAQRAQKKQLPIAYVFGRAEQLPFRDGNFDAVVVGSAFHWFAHKRAVLEIKRVMNPGGLLYIFQYRYPTTEREEEYNEEGPLLRCCGVEYPASERARATPEFIKGLIEDCGFEYVQICTIRKLRRYSIADRVGRIKTLSAYALLSPRNRREVILALTHILHEKWGGKKYRLIPQVVDIFYGYKPK
ncbi:MAG: methyltransferase domain-containing protein [Patescibacteria group bacterium]|nr:methyltransferase domain-containing protein [Patescibacteria group bacterium]